MVIKVYDVPVLFLPKLAHPDPTVREDQDFLFHHILTQKSWSRYKYSLLLGLDNDKDLTIKNKLFVKEHPLFLGEYRQAFLNSDLTLDFGYTGGYKKNLVTKKRR